ncbi:DNA topoisomerase III [Thalassolituus oleivorans]|uniref:DNA topoisomerase III n=1 Tax=Thalassolituus oleivorans TaxID=187493 RepID=UPI001CE2CF2B|nr:DNA topoisomerase III [Thalassolituus oleivorans]MCA6127569.1 DNA topoisomerase III [Thalassolituus oleivorans 4BN06-13]
MRLIIAEKPSLGRAIAAVLPQPHSKGEGFVRAANGDVVSWCIGHLLEQAQPEAYNPQYKQWQLDHLPIVPDEWQLEAKAQTRKQLSVLRKLVKEADSIVHAGDPDREGQLLVDEVIAFLKVPATKRSSMQRLLVSDLNPQAVTRALQQLRPNKDFIPLSVSALARSRADWLYGINLTRAYTLKGQQGGLKAVLSVGRVQTPILGLIVRRDNEIADFISKPFYEVFAALHLNAEQPLSFYAKWQPSKSCQAHQDDEGRVLNPKLAYNVAQRIRQQAASVTSIERKLKKQAAPLPYNLSSLQIDAAKAFGLSAQQVLDSCQSLYEKHQLITYPRSDCRYLPTEHYARRSVVLSAIANSANELASGVAQADTQYRSKAWDDKKVEAHHAIIPTEKSLDTQRLSRYEQKVYQLIARQYVMQFYPAFEYADTRIELDIAGGVFVATERETIKLGWKQLLPARKQSDQNADQDPSRPSLPKLEKGQVLWSGEPDVQEKNTQPPAYFTDATLLAAMTGIARFVKDSELKKILKETDGLGTEATRAGIIELLFKRRFLQREGKSIRATDLGKALVAALPEACTLPDMTAQWEKQLNDITQKLLNYDQFMQPLALQLDALINQAKQLDIGRFGGISMPAFKPRKGGSAVRKSTAPRKSASPDKSTRSIKSKRKPKAW